MATLDHEGCVKIVSDKQIEVEILRSSACSGCHQEGACGILGSSTMTITLDTNGRHFELGDRVTVLMEENQGVTAVIWAYALPMVGFLAVFFTLFTWTGKEALAGSLAVFFLCPYYFVLWCFRKKLNKKFEFRLK